MAYPTDVHYDPNRPSWLPYWIDTLTETDKLVKLKGHGFVSMMSNQDLTRVDNKVLPKLSTPAAPQTYAQMTNPTKWTPEIMVEENKKLQNKWAEELFGGVPKDDPELRARLGWMVGIAGMVIVGLVLVRGASVVIGGK